jgi:hypothetical protein
MLGPAFSEGQNPSYSLWNVLRQYVTHYRLFAGVDPPASENTRSVLTIFKPVAFQPAPHRPWAFPCRSLCGLDLHRPHATCIAFCRLRRIYTGKLPNPTPLEGIKVIWLRPPAPTYEIHVRFNGGRYPYNLEILAGRRFHTVKEKLLSWLVPLCERLPNLPQRKMLLTICEVLAN